MKYYISKHILYSICIYIYIFNIIRGVKCFNNNVKVPKMLSYKSSYDIRRVKVIKSIMNRNQNNKIQNNNILITPTTAPTLTTLFSSNNNNNNNNNNNDTTNPLPDRLLSCFPYLLPLADGCSFGRYIYSRFPPIGAVERFTLQPLSDLFGSVPFSGLVVFVAFTFAARQRNLPRYVRFNIQQAVLLDIALVFPSLFGSAADNLPRYLVEPATNFVFYCFVAATGYSLFWNLVRGEEPDQIPVVSDAARQQIGPF
mmetsp:Transcript_16781/g.33472  ORF Transcript_16781/g.33472 Transcript_16781/m.33472 type:complete len:255 (+) Transcript_16781:205-969(+)